MYDQANRDIHCLRLSLTESCNLRCCYCRPQEPAALPPQELTDAELLHLVQLFAACGIDTLRLTGRRAFAARRRTAADRPAQGCARHPQGDPDHQRAPCCRRSCRR